MTSLFSRIIPFPVLSLTIAVIWILLNQNTDAWNLIIGTLLGLSGGKAYKLLDLPKAHCKKIGVILKLIFYVAVDIVKANFDTIFQILNWNAKVRSGFLTVPLELKDKNALAVLAIIVAATPGSMWINYNRHWRSLTLHVLIFDDEDEWIEQFKLRYEVLLMEIYE